MVASTLPVHVNSASTRRWLIYRLISRIQVDVVERKRRWIGHHVDEILSHPAAGRRANQPHSKGSANFTDVAAGLGRGEQVTALLKGDLVFGRVLKLRPMDHSARLWPPVPRMEPGRLGRLRIARWRSPRPGDHPALGEEKIVGGALGVCGFSLGAKVTRGDSLHRIAVSPLARRPHSRRPLEDSRLH